MAFQLRDDLLGLYGDPDVTGKPTGEDLRLGRPTVLLELARELGGPWQTARLHSILAEPEPDIVAIAALIEQTGAVSKVEQKIRWRLHLAQEALRTAPMSVRCRDGLAELATAAAWRNS